MIARIPCGLADLVDHVWRRRQIGIAHSEVDDVVAGAPTGSGQLGDLGKDIGWQAIQFVEVVSEFVSHLRVLWPDPTLRALPKS